MSVYKGDYHTLVEIKSTWSRDGRLVTSIHTVRENGSHSVKESNRILAFLAFHWCSLWDNGAVFLWKYIFIKYRRCVRYADLMLEESCVLPFSCLIKTMKCTKRFPREEQKVQQLQKLLRDNLKSWNFPSYMSGTLGLKKSKT